MAAQYLETVTEVYVVRHGGCPTHEELRSSGFVEKTTRTADSWGTALRVSCTNTGPVVVTSAGPDQRFGTHDDLTTSNPGRWPYD